jgi:bacillithiol biosynthesis cysteine-adding enzyme BshC
VAPHASESATRIAVDVRRFPWIRRLAADYIYNFPAVARFYAGNPAEHDAWTRAIERARGHRRLEIARVVAAQQQGREAPSQAIEAARMLADPGTVAIVTGQQAGLFGGPLYTLLKALSALKLADRIAREHHVPTVAVFWIEAEDHDWNEVRSATVFDESLAPKTITLPSELMLEPGPVGSVRLDDSVSAAVDELERILPATEFRPALISDLRSIYAPGSGMADAFGRWLERVLGHMGLVVFDASDPAAKPLVRHVFTTELSSAGETARRATASGAELVQRGYHAQVQPQPDAAGLFVLDGGRQPIHHAGGQFQVGEHRYSTADLVQEAADHPAGFSANVLLRPIVQDTLFPTIAYVAGPNELAYLGQLRGVYEYFSVPMPLMVQRPSATLVDSAALKFLSRYEVPLELLAPDDEALLNALLERQIPKAVEKSFDEASNAISTSMNALMRTIPAVDPTLEGATKSTLGKMTHDLETLHGKMIQAAKRRDETLRRQFTRTRSLAFPNGHAQEREIGFVSFLNQYGPALVERLHAELPLDAGSHWIIAI